MKIKASGDESDSLEAWARFTDCSEAHRAPRKRRGGSFPSIICLGGPLAVIVLSLWRSKSKTVPGIAIEADPFVLYGRRY